MAANKDPKTNAMRELEKAGIAYEPIYYDPDEGDDDHSIIGIRIAEKTGLPQEQVFKTLVGRGDKTGPVVFCIPVNGSLNLKRAAVVSGNKRVELLAVKELLPTTGYIRGGCSPIGMKKKFPTYVEASCLGFEWMTVSAGVRGCQLRLKPQELLDFVKATPAPDILE